MVYNAYRYKATPARLVPVKGGTSISLVTTPPPPSPTGFALVLDEQFADNSAGRWNVYDNNTFGAPARIQKYMAANTLFGAGASAGATNGTSLRQVVRRDNPDSSHIFSAGMLDTQGVGKYYPLYNRMEFRVKIPHGHGVWPSTWLTARNGGATMAEWDMVEYFHGQIPGRNSSTLHGTNGSGTFVANRYTNNQQRTFFEIPTYTPGWHTWTSEILPVTDSTGTTVGDKTSPSKNVRFRMLLDGTEVYKFVDTDALYWTTNGSTDLNAFWQIYIQGSQIDGNFIGHPDGELAYSELRNACLISGSPGACVKASGGYNVIRAGAAGATATMGGAAVTYEHDYIRIYKAV